MMKFEPTKLTCDEILNKLCGYYPGSKYIRTTFDGQTTHALYNVDKDEVNEFKVRIKDIGGKYIRVVSVSKTMKIICFQLKDRVAA